MKKMEKEERKERGVSGLHGGVTPTIRRIDLWANRFLVVSANLLRREATVCLLNGSLVFSDSSVSPTIFRRPNFLSFSRGMFGRFETRQLTRHVFEGKSIRLVAINRRVLLLE